MYRVIDKISEKIVEFEDQMDAEIVAQHLIVKYENAKLVIRGKDYIICEC